MAAFLVTAFGLSWLCWVPAALSEAGLSSDRVRWLVYAGSFGPGMAGIALVHLTGTERGRSEYWARITQLRRIRFRWLMAMLLLYPLIMSIAWLLEAAVTGIGPDTQTARRLLAEPASLVVFTIWVLLLGPLPEELGWRGYALDELQRSWSALNASLILGLVWAIWHLPLFFVRGSYQFKLGFGSMAFWSYAATIVALSVLFACIHNNNGRSTLAAIVFHFVLNFTGSLVQGTLVTEVARMTLLATAATLAVWRWTPRTLSTYGGRGSASR